MQILSLSRRHGWRTTFGLIGIAFSPLRLTIRNQTNLMFGLGCLLMFFATLVHAQAGCLSIMANGGNNNNSADNTAAFNTTVSQLTSRGGCILFPPGKYKFNSALSITYPASLYSVSVVGSGADNTTLYFPNSNGLTVSTQNNGTILQSIHVRDLSFTTDGVGAYAALQIVNAGASTAFPQSEILRTTFRGDDGAALASYWFIAVNDYGLSNINFEGDLFYGRSTTGSAPATGGTGVNLTGVSGGKFSANVAQSSFFSLDYGVSVNSNISSVSFSQSNFTNGTTCIIVPPGQTGVSNVALIGGNQLNCQATQVLLQSPVSSFLMNGNLVYLGFSGVQNIGVWIDTPGPTAGPQAYSIVNNVFAGLAAACGCAISGSGIVVNNGTVAAVKNGAILGNVFYSLATGIDLTSASNWNVQSNNYDVATVTQVSNPNQATAHNSVGVATN